MEQHEYTDAELTVVWQPKLCTHSGICVKNSAKKLQPERKTVVQTGKCGHRRTQKSD